jgi:hypothetical protein
MGASGSVSLISGKSFQRKSFSVEILLAQLNKRGRKCWFSNPQSFVRDLPDNSLTEPQPTGPCLKASYLQNLETGQGTCIGTTSLR